MKRSLLSSVAIVGLIAVSGCLNVARAGEFEDGLAASKIGDYTTAAQDWKIAADQGSAEAEGNLAYLYMHEQGTPQDYIEAARLSEQSAQQGCALGEAVLAALYDDGNGVTKNYAEAARLAKLSADQGDGYGEAVLGTLYKDGHGVEASSSEALHYYQLSANQGNPVGEYNLGIDVDWQGAGGEPENSTAASLIRRSANQGYLAAIKYLTTAQDGSPANIYEDDSYENNPLLFSR